MALVSICAFVVYTLCFVVILLANPPFQWEGIAHFVRYTLENEQACKHLGMLCMLVFGCAYTVIALCERDTMQPERRLLGDIAAAFALAFCVCIGINYFVQLTATRLQIELGHAYAAGLEQITQSFPISALNAVNMLGWTVFYGLSSLSLFFAYCKAENASVLRFFCLANSIMMFLGAAGYACNIYLVLLLCMNLGLGATTLGILFCLLKRYKA